MIKGNLSSSRRCRWLMFRIKLSGVAFAVDDDEYKCVVTSSFLFRSVIIHDIYVNLTMKQLIY